MRTRSRLFCAILIVVSGLVSLSASAIVRTQTIATAQATPQPVPHEYRLKAAFIYQFPQFVDWPAEAWDDAKVVELCVLRPNPFGAELEQLVRGESLRGRPIAIRQVEPDDSIASCHLLFLTNRSDGAMKGLLKQATARAILTVGDSERFLDEGGIIALKVADRRVRFDINVSNARRAGLRISSQLLNLAQAVRGGSL